MPDTSITTDINARMVDLTNALKLRLELGGKKETIVRRQAGLLWRTLINISPPHNRAKSAARIHDRVLSRFHEMGSDSGREMIDTTKSGKGNVRWYASTPHAVYGVAKDVDFRSADVDQLRMLYLGRTSKKSPGRVNVGRRGKQTFYIYQKITTKKATVNKLIRRFVNNLGRLKAGWSVAWKTCGSPGAAIPQWISVHFNGARGDVIDELRDENPSIAAINRGKGASEITKNNILNAALRIRAQAVVRDVAFAIREPQKWRERESASGGEELSE